MGLSSITSGAVGELVKSTFKFWKKICKRAQIN